MAPTRNQNTVSSHRESQTIGLALSGGGSRAIAYHLGCLRALDDRGILPNVTSISGVSGGAVIAGLYAYSDVPFPEFDNQIVQLLRQGLKGGLVRRTISNFHLRAAISLAFLVPKRLVAWAAKSDPPMPRWKTPTDALEELLDSEDYFNGQGITDVRRPGLEVIFTACELRTGTAFRFGNKVSGSWRLGELKQKDVKVAHAVASSAAFPLLLPAFDRIQEFINPKDKKTSTFRTIVTDGGVFDNLGITALKPDQSNQVSLFKHAPDFIISCSAGYGAFDDKSIPVGFLRRLMRVNDVTFKKNQDALIDRLHTWVESGMIKGMIFSYLGQQDSTLQRIRPDLITREEVFSYPTNFSPMKDEDIHKLSMRGEQLTRMHIARHCPWL